MTELLTGPVEVIGTGMLGHLPSAWPAGGSGWRCSSATLSRRACAHRLGARAGPAAHSPRTGPRSVVPPCPPTTSDQAIREALDASMRRSPTSGSIKT